MYNCFPVTIGCDDCFDLSGITPLESLLTKQCALTSGFSEDRKELYIGLDNGINLVSYPVVTNIEFAESNGVTDIPYTITLEADNIFCDGVGMLTTPDPTGCLVDFTESWSINSTTDNGIVNHNIQHAVSQSRSSRYKRSIITNFRTNKIFSTLYSCRI